MRSVGGYQRDANGEPTGLVRLHATRMVTNNDQVQGAVADLAALNRRFRSEHFTVRTLKIVADGVIENRQAAMLEPYQQPAGARGQLALSEANVQGLLHQCERAGFDVHFHTIGDASLRQALGAARSPHQRVAHPDGRPLNGRRPELMSGAARCGCRPSRFCRRSRSSPPWW